jgi:hypothetical protein
MYDIPIERGKINEFARAAKSKHPEYEAVDAPIPPTFLTTAGNFWAPPGPGPMAKIGFALARLLHGEEEYIFHGPPPQAGQTLTVSSRLAEQYEKEGKRGGVMRFAVLVTEYRDAAGTLVVEQRTTAVETAKAPS